VVDDLLGRAKVGFTVNASAFETKLIMRMHFRFGCGFTLEITAIIRFLARENGLFIDAVLRLEIQLAVST